MPHQGESKTCKMCCEEIAACGQEMPPLAITGKIGYRPA